MEFFFLLASLLTVQALPFNVSHAQDEKGLGGDVWWVTTCGNTLFAGSYKEMMEWESCKTWCSDISLGGDIGESFTFSDLRDEDEGLCVKEWMTSEYAGTRGYVGHYWLGGFRDETGEYQWASGHPMTYTDFVNKPGSKPYIHLTPGNGYAWNTKNDQNDQNNGCLCRLDRN